MIFNGRIFHEALLINVYLVRDGKVLGPGPKDLVLGPGLQIFWYINKEPAFGGNQTAVVKNAYTEFIIPTGQKIEFPLSKRNSLQRLMTTKAKKSINFKPTFETSQNMQSEPEVYDLTITEKETTLQNSLETTLEPDENSEDTSMGNNLEYEFHMGSL
ncbi:hypothetical protein RhiirA4_469663 [Rhizophagus irregularis]|uniref:Uncharacterized protein n=1 Tax=Rhizophagus irregularis TaxID=588596 RepID=A0A2I1GZX9_9GLOM|nr:hypothetical protein RhiirA4_469663 [Rhizophagus irregularis]